MWRIVGIDPGLRKTLGFVLVRVPLGEVPLGEDVKVFVEEARLLDVTDWTHYRIALAVQKIAEPANEVLIEQFNFYGPKEKKFQGKGFSGRASWFTALKMNRFTHYLAGFLAASGKPVEFVAPSSWKRWADEAEARQVLERQGFEAKPHTASALAMVLGELRKRKA